MDNTSGPGEPIEQPAKKPTRRRVVKQAGAPNLDDLVDLTEAIARHERNVAQAADAVPSNEPPRTRPATRRGRRKPAAAAAGAPAVSDDAPAESGPGGASDAGAGTGTGTEVQAQAQSGGDAVAAAVDAAAVDAAAVDAAGTGAGKQSGARGAKSAKGAKGARSGTGSKSPKNAESAQGVLDLETGAGAGGAKGPGAKSAGAKGAKGSKSGKGGKTSQASAGEASARAAKGGADAGDSQAAAGGSATKGADAGTDASIRLPVTALLFQPPELTAVPPKAAPEKPTEEATKRSDTEGDSSAGSAAGRRRRGTRGKGAKTQGGAGSAGTASAAEGEAAANADASDKTTAKAEQAPATEASGPSADSEASDSPKRRRRRSRGTRAQAPEDESGQVAAPAGSTRLEAKRQRRKETRDHGRKRTTITEAEFLARRESVDRDMVVRESHGRTQIAVLEDGILVEHYVARRTQSSLVGNVYLGRVQNVLPSMEAAFVDIGKGRNAVLYAGEVNWDAAGLEGQPRRIEQALKSGDSVMVQVTKDPIGHKGARLTAQITLAGRFLVYVPSGAMTGISRKLPEAERTRLKRHLKEIVPEGAGVIVRTAAEGAREEELRQDIERLSATWQKIQDRAKTANAPALLKGEPDLAIRVVRDVFNEDFRTLTVSGKAAWDEITTYLGEVAPELLDRVTRWTSELDVFAADRIDEQLAKGMDRKVWLPSGGSLVIDRTEAMTVIDVNTGKFTGTGGTLEETVTRNNLEAAEEIVRQLRLRDIGGIIVIDFIDMVLESNRDLVLRRLIEALSRDRTRHQVAEVTTLGLVQMTRKRVGQGLVEAFSDTCECCGGRGFIVHSEPVEKDSGPAPAEREGGRKKRGGKKKKGHKNSETPAPAPQVVEQASDEVKATLANIAAAAAHSRSEDATSA